MPNIEVVEESEGICYDTGNRLTEDVEEVIVIQTTTCFTDIAWQIAVNGRWQLPSQSNHDRVSAEEE